MWWCHLSTYPQMKGSPWYRCRSGREPRLTCPHHSALWGSHCRGEPSRISQWCNPCRESSQRRDRTCRWCSPCPCSSQNISICCRSYLRKCQYRCNCNINIKCKTLFFVERFDYSYDFLFEIEFLKKCFIPFKLFHDFFSSTLALTIRDKPGGKASRGVLSLFESQMFIFLSKFLDNTL